MKTAISCAVLACASTVSLAQAPAFIEIELRGDVEATQRPLRLADVAYVRSSDLDGMLRLLEVGVATPVRPGEQVTISRADLQRRMQHVLHSVSSRVQWAGGDRAVVRGVAEPTPERQLEHTARGVLQDWLARKGIRAGVEPMPLEEVRLPAGKVAFQARPVTAGTASPRMVVWTDAWVDGSYVRTVPVSFAVEFHRVASEARAEPTPIEVAPVPVVKQGTVNVPATVRRGEWVAVGLSSGLLQLEARAEVLQEGRAGDVVRVRLTGATNAVEARVVGRGRVEATP